MIRPQAQASRSTYAPSATWSDLYYDVAVVAAVVVLSTVWGHDHSWHALIRLSLVFGLIWMMWILTNLALGSFTKRAKPPQALDVALITGQMAMVLLVALSATDEAAFAELIVAGPLALGLVTILVLGARAKARGVEIQRRALLLVGGSAVLVMLAFALAEVAVGWSSLCWTLALLSAAVATWSGLRQPAIARSRLGHRFGELTIIVIGESLLKMALAAQEKGWTALHPGALALALLIVTALWWDYFSDAVRRPPGPGRRRVWWSQAQVLLHFALIGTAVGLGKLVVDDEALGHGGTSLLIGLPLTLAFGALALLDAFGGPQLAPRGAGLHAITALALLATSLFGWVNQDVDPQLLVTFLAIFASVGTGFIAALPESARTSRHAVE